ncbi:sugar phosphate nucleotidyltransferase, partial [Kocuria oceani]
MRIPRTLALVLAGGKGSRLAALTEKKVKPALPVAGTYRLVDVALSNLVHSHISDVWVVQQYLPHSLNRHLANGRPWDLDRTHGGLQVLPPYEGTEDAGFAEGNADSLYRQKDLIR